jgi:hypothetical protein
MLRDRLLHPAKIPPVLAVGDVHNGLVLIAVRHYIMTPYDMTDAPDHMLESCWRLTDAFITSSKATGSNSRSGE